jgi:hypothetical protein
MSSVGISGLTEVCRNILWIPDKETDLFNRCVVR